LLKHNDRTVFIKTEACPCCCRYGDKVLSVQWLATIDVLTNSLLWHAVIDSNNGKSKWVTITYVF
jgi:hypothetical protein